MLHLTYAFPHSTKEIHSPHCITRNLYNYLNSRTDVKYYQWDHRGVADIKPNDVFIGHPHYEPSTIVQRTFAEKKCKFMATIHPLHTAIPEHNMPFDHLARKADKIFSICGPYWYDTIDQTGFSHWKPKITRLDMAVDPLTWKYQKHKFNNPGERGVVYIGSSMPMKNLEYLYQIVKHAPDIKFRWYGGSGDHPLNSLPNMKVIGWCDFSNQQILDELYSFADIFINVSNSDANPTTLLEFGLAGGLIPICTQTSGYWNDESFINVPLHDHHLAITTIKEWLNKPSVELSKFSQKNRSICETKYTWERFCQIIWKEIKDYL